MWVVSSLELLQITLLETTKYKSWGRCMFSLLWDKNMEVDFGTLSTCLTLEDLTILFSKLLVPFSLPISNIWEFHLLHIVTNTWYHQFF